MKTLLAGAQILKLEKIVQMSGAGALFVGSVQAIVNCPSCQTVTSKVHIRYERLVRKMQSARLGENGASRVGGYQIAPFVPLGLQLSYTVQCASSIIEPN
jgi:hypothetical protein